MATEQIDTELIDDGSGRIRLRTHRLRIDVVGGPCAGQVVDLPGPEVTIGSGKGSALLLLDNTVSRHHATLRVDGNDVRVIDAGSSNGTSVDGVRIRDAYARPNSVITLGSSQIRLQLSRDVVEVRLSKRRQFGGLLGASAAMRRVFTLLELVSKTDDTVLVAGETGTGKELVAEAIHEESRRNEGPFIVFDCSAISPNLIESELLGHERGAFTGAIAAREGAFEAADGGTLFLDEIGELPLELQPKLLRALERRQIKRVGSNTVRQVDVRVVAATNRQLLELVSQGRFREDLYYRLAVVEVPLPPLRERLDDIPLLVEHFARQLGRGEGQHLAERFLRSLQERSWPGNVRELRNAVARHLALAPGATLPPVSEVPGQGSAEPTIDLSVPLKEGRTRLLESFERAYCLAALQSTGGNATKAAELAGVNRKFFQRAIKRYGLRDTDADGNE